ncbi:MAG: adenylosuccinate synthetase, partial [Candidatus Obscuribacterales bacterium]|nr:adenylosuccinate synthetase [Candidatus Obscuribacterales bacterium]
INQTCERSRGSARHGSCGLGINETVTRCLGNSQNATRVEDLLRPQQLRKKLAFLKQTWFYARLEELSISDEVSISDDDLDEVLECFLLDVEAMLDSVTITSTPPVRNRIIFEGAQGLLLDEARIDLFPHVTRSRPGLANVVHLADSCGIEQLTVTYVTRSYLTRHGAGPLPGESTLNFADLTNVENAFQGRLRFAPLDLGRLKDTIEADLKLVAGKNVMANIALTCLDQHDISPSTDLEVKYMSYGPARTDVEHRIGRRSFLASKKTSYSSRFAIAK